MKSAGAAIGSALLGYFLTLGFAGALAAAEAQLPPDPKPIGLPPDPKPVGMPPDPKYIGLPDNPTPAREQPAATPTSLRETAPPSPRQEKAPSAATSNAGKGLPAPAPGIILPDVLAVELPKGMTEIGPSDPALHDILASARDGSRKISWDLNRKVGIGPVRVTWTSWDGAAGAGKAVSTRTARLFVLPFGMTPVGVSSNDNATGGNNAVHIARDATGRVHMVWQDGGRKGALTGAVYRRAAIDSTGKVKFETGPIYIADAGPSDWNANPSLAVSRSNVQLAWQGAGTVRTRRVSLGPGGWVMGNIVDTHAKSEGRDVGPAIVFDSKGGIHIATPSGVYAYSGDDGKSWRAEPVPLQSSDKIKTQSLAVDPSGVVHIVVSAVVERTNPTSAVKLGGYWRLLLISRMPNGTWTNPTDILANQPNWNELKGTGDMLADWVRIVADIRGGLHVGWHGTANSHQFGHDDAFYAFKKPGGSWSTPVQLVSQDTKSGVRYSFAPSLALDGDRALALTFFDVYAGAQWLGFDSRLVSLRDGQKDGPAMPLTEFVQAAKAAKQPDRAMGPRFPAAAPDVWKSAGNPAVLDVVELLQSPLAPTDSHLVVYQRVVLPSAGGKR